MTSILPGERKLGATSKTPIFGQPKRRSRDLMGSDTCEVTGEGDFGQLRRDSHRVMSTLRTRGLPRLRDEIACE